MSVDDVVDLFVERHGRDGAEEQLQDRLMDSETDDERVLAAISELRKRKDGGAS